MKQEGQAGGGRPTEGDRHCRPGLAVVSDGIRYTITHQRSLVCRGCRGGLSLHVRSLGQPCTRAGLNGKGGGVKIVHGC